MSEATIVQLEKKRNELETELSSKIQREAALEKELKTLEEELTAQLNEKIKAKNTELERLESAKSTVEKRLAELRGHAKTSEMPDGTWEKAAESKEQSEQPTQAAVADQRFQQTDEIKEKPKEEKRRKWM